MYRLLSLHVSKINCVNFGESNNNRVFTGAVTFHTRGYSYTSSLCNTSFDKGIQLDKRYSCPCTKESLNKTRNLHAPNGGSRVSTVIKEFQSVFFKCIKPRKFLRIYVRIRIFNFH